MSKLSIYIENNKDFLYYFALKNSAMNHEGVVVIPKHDEWCEEIEWENCNSLK